MHLMAISCLHSWFWVGWQGRLENALWLSSSDYLIEDSPSHFLLLFKFHRLFIGTNCVTLVFYLSKIVTQNLEISRIRITYAFLRAGLGIRTIWADSGRIDKLRISDSDIQSRHQLNLQYLAGKGTDHFSSALPTEHGTLLGDRWRIFLFHGRPCRLP